MCIARQGCFASNFRELCSRQGGTENIAINIKYCVLRAYAPFEIKGRQVLCFRVTALLLGGGEDFALANDNNITAVKWSQFLLPPPSSKRTRISKKDVVFRSRESPIQYKYFLKMTGWESLQSWIVITSQYGYTPF